MTEHYRHATGVGTTRRWLASLVVLLLALGSPLAAWAAGGEDEPEIAATESTEEPAEAPAEEPAADEPPAEAPEEAAPEPEPQPEPPPSPEPTQEESSAQKRTSSGRTGGGGGEEATSQIVAVDEPGATSAGGVTPTLVLGNPPCPAGTTELKADPPNAGVYTDGTLTLTLTTSPTPANGSIGWTSNIGIDYVFVKGGSNASQYTYSPESTGDSGLTAPLNTANGRYFGVSHVSFCYDLDKPTIEVIKHLVPPDDPGLFNLRINRVTYKTDASHGDTTGPIEFDPGTYPVRETAGTGTELNDYTHAVECRDENGEGDVVASANHGGPVDVTVDFGDKVVCIFTNTRKTGDLEVVKELIPSDDPGLFDLQIDGNTEKADASDGDTTGPVTVNTGTHTVGEAAGSGTNLDDYDSSIECRDENGQGDIVAQADGSGPLNVEVGDGDDIVCVITNERKTGEIEVVKELIPSDDPGLFDLQIDGNTEKADASDGDTTGPVTVNTGTHTVGEAAGTGTSLGDYSSSIECRDENGQGDIVAQADGSGPLNVEVGDGDDIVCVITNERAMGQIEVVKDLIPSDDPGRFDLQIDGNTQADDVGDGGTTGKVAVNTGTHTVGEIAGVSTSLGDYNSSIECRDQGGQGDIVAQADGSGPLNVDVDDGDDIVCVITNERKTATIEVIKDLIPDDDPGLFDLQIDGTTEFDDASDGDTTGPVTVNTGDHTVGEVAGTGTNLGDYNSSIECLNEAGATVASSDDAGPLTVTVNEDVVCTITNERKTGEIEVIKDVIPSDDPGLFDLQIDGNTQADDVGDGGTTGKVSVGTGTHTVGEVAGASTSLGDYNSSIECRDQGGQGQVVASGDGSGPLNVEVGDGDDIVCVITNERKTGEIEVVKDLIPDDDPGLFDLQINGNTEFDDASDGDTTGPVTVNTGTHTVGEIAGTNTTLDDYNSSIECVNGGQTVASGDGAGPLNVDVGDGDHIVCTITNERKTGQIEVVKDLIPDDDPGLFDLQIDGATAFADASDGDSTGKVTVNTGTHTVGEVAGTGTNLADYASEISCVDEGGQGAEVAAMIGTGPLEVEVGDGDDIVCTITNTFIEVAGQPIITVQKTNDADGDGNFRDRERGVEGEPVTFKVVIRNVSAVPVVIDSITDSFGGTTINVCQELIGTTLNPGESVTCFFTVQNYVPGPGDILDNTVTVTGHSADDETQTVEASDDSTVVSIEVLGGVTGTDEGGTLAFTGAELLMLALMALALIVAGAPLVIFTRRRGESPNA